MVVINEFVPDECSALAIQACKKALDCLFEKLNIPDLADTFETSKSLSVDVNAEGNAQNECFLAGLEEAFAAAGETMPYIPEPPEPPALTACQEQVEALQAQASDPLSFLGGVIEIDFDADGKPTKIRVNG